MDAGLGVDKSYSPIKKGRKKIVSHTPVRRSPRDRSGLSSHQLDDAEITLGTGWRGLILAGKQDASVDIETEGEHSCGARATLDDGTTIDGFFDSDKCHAEMETLENVIAAGYTLANITLIEIEKQPCPRCAVVLNKLHLQNKVKYKTSGQKDYPTWRYPNLGAGHNWAVTMDVSGQASKASQQQTLLNYFRFNKWWA
jgi:hypothetical protein